MNNFNEKPKAYHQVRSLLEDVVNGNITREACRQGLCTVVDIDGNGIRPKLNSSEVLRGYKFWSGQMGYTIYVGETTEEGRANREYSNESINQFKREARQCGHEDKDFCDQYWEARLELARHWIRYLDKVIGGQK